MKQKLVTALVSAGKIKRPGVYSPPIRHMKSKKWFRRRNKHLFCNYPPYYSVYINGVFAGKSRHNPLLQQSIHVRSDGR